MNDGKNELVNALNTKNDELNNINQRIRDIRRYGQINLFDCSDISQDDETDVNNFLSMTGNNVILFENDSNFDVINNVFRDTHPFIFKSEIKINDNNSASINNFFKDVKAPDKWIEKINEEYDETLNITFTVDLITYTKTFNKKQ